MKVGLAGLTDGRAAEDQVAQAARITALKLMEAPLLVDFDPIQAAVI
jgi:hypothetical protein